LLSFLLTLFLLSLFDVHPPPLSSQRYGSSLNQAKDAGIRKSYRCGFANGLLFSTGNLMAAAGFLFGAWKIKKALNDTYNADLGVWDSDGEGGFTPRLDPVTGMQEMGANCRNGGIYIPTCSFSGGNIMIAMFAIE